MATPNKLTDELVAEAARLLRQGNYRNTVARAVGVTPETFSNWMHKQGSPYAEFQETVHAAEAYAEAHAVELITSSPETIDQKWFLARKFPDRWAETRRVDLTGRIEHGMRLSADALNDPSARQHIMGLADWLFSADPTTGDDSPDSAGEN